MKRMVLLGTLAGALMLTSCATISISGDAQLAPKSSVCWKESEKHFWFLFGLFPIGGNSTDDVIPKGEKVRIETKYTLADLTVFFMTYGIIIPRTAEIYVCK